MARLRKPPTCGFSLLELLLVVALVGVLAAIALPSWRAYLARVERTDARASLLRMGAEQEQYFIRHGAYAGDTETLGMGPGIARSHDGHYRLSVVATTADSYRLRATRIADDREARRCATFELDQRQRRYSAPADVDECWMR